MITIARNPLFIALFVCDFSTGNYAKALDLQERCLEICAEHFGLALSLLGNPGNASNNSNSAANAPDGEDPAQKAGSDRASLAQQFSDSPALQMFAQVVFDLANVYYRKGTYDRAEILYLEALRLRSTLHLRHIANNSNNNGSAAPEVIEITRFDTQTVLVALPDHTEIAQR